MDACAFPLDPSAFHMVFQCFPMDSEAFFFRFIIPRVDSLVFHMDSTVFHMAVSRLFVW